MQMYIDAVKAYREYAGFDLLISDILARTYDNFCKGRGNRGVRG